MQYVSSSPQPVLTPTSLQPTLASLQRTGQDRVFIASALKSQPQTTANAIIITSLAQQFWGVHKSTLIVLSLGGPNWRCRQWPMVYVYHGVSQILHTCLALRTPLRYNGATIKRPCTINVQLDESREKPFDAIFDYSPDQHTCAYSALEND